MVDGKSPKSPDELSRAFEQAFSQPATRPKEVAPQAAPVEVGPKPVVKTEQAAAEDSRAIGATKQAIDQLPEAGRKVAQVVAAPFGTAAQEAHRLLRKKLGTEEPVSMVAKVEETIETKGLGVGNDLVNDVRQLDESAHGHLEEEPN